MFNNYFYNKHIQYTTKGLMLLLKDIMITRESSTDKKMYHKKVPVIYANRHAYLQQIKTKLDDTTSRTAINLPMIAVEITSIDPLESQKVSKWATLALPDGTRVSPPQQVAMVYNVSVIGKSQSDIWQIVEQISPIMLRGYQYRTTPLQDHIGKEQPLSYQMNGGWNIQDDFSGDAGDRRLTTYSAVISAKTAIWGNTDSTNSINNSTPLIKDVSAEIGQSDIAACDLNKTHELSVKVDPIDASEDSDWMAIVDYFYTGDDT